MIGAITEIWTSIVTFLTGLFPQLLSLFWTTTESGGGSLTFVGVMAVITAGVAMMLLIFNLIRSFFTMRG